MPSCALHPHGISGTSTLPACHGDCRFLLGASFLSKLPVLGPMRVSLVCSANPNNHRPRSPDITWQQKGGSSRRKNKPYQEKDDTENIDEFDGDKDGQPISLTSNSRPQATSVPGEREKEIVELFKKVQSKLREKGKGREGKNSEPAKAQGERGSVDSLLKLLRRHSGDQKTKSSDEKEQNSDQARRSKDPGNKQNSSTFNIKSDTLEQQKKPHDASFNRPASNFRRRSPVPGVKFQPVTNAKAKSIANNLTDAIQEAKITLDKKTTLDEYESVSPYEDDSVVPPEDIPLDDFDILDDESDELDTNEFSGEYVDQSVELANVDNIDGSHYNGMEFSSGSPPDISSLKVTELRELAKSRGIKGYSKLKKRELIEVLGNTV